LLQHRGWQKICLDCFRRRPLKSPALTVELRSQNFWRKHSMHRNLRQRPHQNLLLRRLDRRASAMPMERLEIRVFQVPFAIPFRLVSFDRVMRVSIALAVTDKIGYLRESRKKDEIF